MEKSNRSGRLHHRILLGLVLGALAGFAANRIGAADEDAKRAVQLLSDTVAHPVGQVFLRLLFLVVVPLVFASLALGVASLGSLRHLGRTGAWTMALFLLTSLASVVLGVALIHVFQPGVGFPDETRRGLMEAFGSQAQSVAATGQFGKATTTIGTVNQILDAFLPRNVVDAVVKMQMLPLIVFALLFGAALTMVDEGRRAQMTGWLQALSDAMVAIVGLAMKLAPHAVFCLIFTVVARFGLDLLQKLGVYVLIVTGAYLLQLFALYPLMLRLLARRRPLRFLRLSIPVLVTAFSTSSSSATLPTSLRVAQSDLGIRPSVAGFVLPMGATMNMNGTALFEGVLVLFLAQIFGVELTLAQQVLLVLLCVFTSIGAAGVPGGSLPLIMIVMGQVGVPPEGIAIVLGVDRLLDMGRTVVNVAGDLVCAACIERGEPPAPPTGAANP